MTEKSQRSRSVSHRKAVERVRDADTFALNLPVVGRVRIPRPDQLAYYGALTALVLVELIDWPVAVAIAAGHALAHQHHNKIAQELGEALQDV